MVLHVTFGPKSGVADFADVWFGVQMDEHMNLQVGSFAKSFVAASEGALEWLGAVVMVQVGDQAISSLKSLATS